jgi:soluble lytic murein transglycosylase
VGRQYLDALRQKYGGDPAKMWGAYNWGPGNLDNALNRYGGDWLRYAPKETQDYVRRNLAGSGL